MLFKAFAIPLIALSLAAPALAAETLEVVANPQTNRKVTISAFDPIGQSFTAQTNTVSSIGFQFSVLNTGSANSPLTLSLFQGETLTGASLFTFFRCEVKLDNTSAPESPEVTKNTMPSTVTAMVEMIGIGSWARNR